MLNKIPYLVLCTVIGACMPNNVTLCTAKTEIGLGTPSLILVFVVHSMGR